MSLVLSMISAVNRQQPLNGNNYLKILKNCQKALTVFIVIWNIKMFNNLINKLNHGANLSFMDATNHIDTYIQQLPKIEFLDVLIHIGIIPESIEHDSTSEKLFSKSSDAVLSRAFREIGLQSAVLSERADSADVIVKSKFYGYDLVADAKAFRLSRTAKNQKDFKVDALSNWRNNSNFAVLTSPYFQYPSHSSQIYAQSLNKNVCLLSWEHLIFLIKNNIQENEYLNLSLLWNFSHTYSQNCAIANQKLNFLPAFNEYFCQVIGQNTDRYYHDLTQQILSIKNRAEREKQYWVLEEIKIKNYTHEQAILELLAAKKIDNKIKQIDKYVKGLK